MKFFKKIGNLIIVLLFFLLISCNEITDNPNHTLRCGEDNSEPIPLSADNLLPSNEIEVKNKRSLCFSKFKDFNIHLDLYNFNVEIAKYNLED